MRRLLRYLSVNQVMKDIADVNGVMSVKRFVITTIMAGGSVFGACMLYRINYILSLLVMVMALLLIPGLVRGYFKERYDAARFSDVDIYLHQISYSFTRTPKINMALRDVYEISSGNLKECIGKALEELQYGMGDRVYDDALKIIEEEYDCTRIRTLHKFIISVEEKGGRYAGAMEVLLEDFDRWVNNVYRYQEEIHKIKRDISVGIIISMVLAMLTTIMCNMLNMFSDKTVSITDSVAYQSAAVVFVILCMSFFTYTRKHYRFDWLGKSRTDKQIVYDYNIVFKSDVWRLTIKLLPVWLVLIIAMAVLFIFNMKLPAVCMLAIIIVLVSTPFLQKKGAQRRVKNDLYLGFTEWLRELSVNLENKPLLSAVEDTYDCCPVIMKEPLEKFICDIENNPSDVMPYYGFLGEFGVIDIQAAVRMLYSIGELEQDSMSATINAIVRRNYELSDKAELTRYMDSTSMMRFSEYVPTFFVALKMAVDMMLVVTMYL